MASGGKLSSLLVEYSDSSSESEVELESFDLPVKSTLKRKFSDSEDRAHQRKINVSQSETRTSSTLPSVPQGILDMFEEKGTKMNSHDRPEFHQGRFRSFPHERGNWASYVHIPVVADTYWHTLVNAIIACLSEAAEFVVMEDFHLSLSRTFVMRHHWIDSMVSLLKEHLESQQRFTCDLSTVDFYANDEKTRTFVGLKVRCGVDQLKEVVKEVDSCLVEFKLPTYYQDPSFHVSIGWALGDVTDECNCKVKKKIQAILDDHLGLHPQLGLLDATEIRLKTGNKLFSFSLKDFR